MHHLIFSTRVPYLASKQQDLLSLPPPTAALGYTCAMLWLLSGYRGAELEFLLYPPLPFRIFETGSCCVTQSGYTPALRLAKSFLVIPLQPLGLGLVVCTL